MTKVKQFFQILLGFLFIGIGIAAIYFFLKAIWTNFTTLQTEVATAVVAGSVTIIVGIGTVFIGRYYEKKRQIELEHREKKVEIYESFMAVWFERILKGKKEATSTTKVVATDQQNDDLENFLRDFTRNAILWSSHGVIKKYAVFRDSTLNAKQASVESLYETLFQFEDVLFEIRKDLGNSNRGLKKGDLLVLFINDLKKATEPKQ